MKDTDIDKSFLHTSEDGLYIGVIVKGELGLKPMGGMPPTYDVMRRSLNWYMKSRGYTRFLVVLLDQPHSLSHYQRPL